MKRILISPSQRSPCGYRRIRADTATTSRPRPRGCRRRFVDATRWHLRQLPGGGGAPALGRPAKRGNRYGPATAPATGRRPPRRLGLWPAQERQLHPAAVRRTWPTSVASVATAPRAAALPPGAFLSRSQAMPAYRLCRFDLAGSVSACLSPASWPRRRRPRAAGPVDLSRAT